MGFTRAELESFRDATIPDLVEPGVRLLFVGINPGLWTAATGTPFARPGNRFWPALVAAGMLPALPRYAEPLGDDDRRMIVDAGIGVSNLVARATARADELSRDELRAGASALAARVAVWRPRAVAVVGLTAYRQGFDRPRAVAGRQSESIADVPTWVLPNPSGLNAHDTVATLAQAYAEPARAAGVIA
ncbi:MULTISPECIES: mismatch-specific DNA-glycosylase [Microbacterium]|uniref:mismatch-specific DNA-glycosylase n=1 Tax=Microbacterium TaxID=33882 RepID=UPI002787B61D|nr:MULTISPECIES: mismatch-specific DNA-glycosylase [Microbacterium]MDQ1083595.1 TDG/mug DNA glycosylase family protein [Microbacterium sp. SORGH_AS_0344]MDQ1171129.1 TDG/mug DNA glycosylase family protein [Microbacterium proteolyticum]